jgi:ABC-2 type transport system ATP-binding protein
MNVRTSAGPSTTHPQDDLGVDVLARSLTAIGPRGPIFTSVDIDVPAGGLGVVAGPSGSGRSTLLLTLAGRFRFDAGELVIGRHRASDGLAALREQSAVARVRPGIEPDEGLSLAQLEQQRTITTGGRATSERIRAARGLLGANASPRMLLGDLHPLDALRHVLALALAEGRPLIVIDDVDAGLMAEERLVAWALLDAVSAEGTTVVGSATERPPAPIEHVVVTLAHPAMCLPASVQASARPAAGR